MSNLRLINYAYVYMLGLIESGTEYPDAQFKASQKFGVSHTELQEMYDGEQFDHAAAVAKRESKTDQRIADKIDGYDRDNIGESPDY